MASFDGIRVAARTLRKQLGFTSVVVLSLALAIALNTTMYSVLDALIHPRVDLRDPGRIYSIRLYGDYHFKTNTVQRDSLLRAAVHNIDGIARDPGGSGLAVFESEKKYVEGQLEAVGVEYFPLIGPRIVRGRVFVPADTVSESNPLVISERLVAELFRPDENPLGARITIDKKTYDVVGVLSRYARFPDEQTDAWRLVKPSSADGMFLRLVRLHSGASANDAARELSFVADRIASVAGEDRKLVDFRFHAPAQPQFHYRSFDIALSLSVLAVLLVACANLANMQLARGIGRRRELALRTALGATRRRIIEHLLTESVLLAASGLVLGLVLTLWGSAILRASIPPSIGSYVVEPHMSWRVLVFALVATLACILLVGVAPAIRVSRVDPSEMLKASAGTGALRKNRRQYGYLVAVEIALALGLLSGAAVIIRSAMRVSSLEMGYDPTPVVTGFTFAQLDRSNRDQKYPLGEYLQSAAARFKDVPGVALAAANVQQSVIDNAVTVSDSGRGVREIPAPMYTYRAVSPGYLRALGLHVIRGRDFLDGERDEPAVIIDDYTAASIWPAANPIGAQIKLGSSKSNAPFVRIVGVASNIINPKYPPSTTEIRMGMVYYLPGPRDSTAFSSTNPAFAFLTVRAAGDPKQLPLQLRRAGMQAVHALGDDRRIDLQNRGFIAKLFTLFAVLGLGLAAFGVYGVVAHSVAERRRELGVRIALGAGSRDILHAVLRESVVIGLAGIALGLLGTKYGVKLLTAFAFEDDMFNAPLFALAALFLFAATAASAFVPALRATRVDPTESLRSE